MTQDKFLSHNILFLFKENKAKFRTETEYCNNNNEKKKLNFNLTYIHVINNQNLITYLHDINQYHK